MSKQEIYEHNKKLIADTLYELVKIELYLDTFYDLGFDLENTPLGPCIDYYIDLLDNAIYNYFGDYNYKFDIIDMFPSMVLGEYRDKYLKKYTNNHFEIEVSKEELFQDFCNNLDEMLAIKAQKDADYESQFN